MSKKSNDKSNIKKSMDDIEQDSHLETSSMSVIDTQDLNDLIEEDLGIKKNNNKSHPIVNFFLIIVVISSLIFFGISLMDYTNSIISIINSLLLTIFAILFAVVSITYNRQSKAMIFVSSLLLFAYFLIGINSHLQIVNFSVEKIPDFSGKKLTEVIKWANKNDITVHQEYEYSDMVDEYRIIGQDIDENTDIKDLKEITVSVSEGANPSKEIIVPSMITWDSERVLKFVKDNYLSNVIVEFVESDKAKDTVIEQSTSGNLKRDDEIKLTFSYGEELGFSEVTLIDFTNKSKFEVEFYMKQNQLKYEFDEDFDNKIKRGYAKSQKIKAGEVVPINDLVVNVTISKGPKIKIPDITKYSMSEITEWAIKNKLKINFIDKYDSDVKENKIISIDKEKGSIVEQGSVIEVVISRGVLKMPRFKSLNDFYTWANKYEIDYEEIHEFSSTVPAGEVISYSYKKGQAIKNNDTIKVTISDGNKKEVPNLKGLSKNEAIKKLENAGLKYSFIYDSSNTVKKNYVIRQSISAGSEISDGITITVTLSNGEKESSSTSQKKIDTDSNKNNNSSNNTNNNTSNNNNNTNNNNNSNTPSISEEKVTVYIYDELIKNSPGATCSAIKSSYPKLNFSCSYVCGPYNGALVNSSSIDEHVFSTNDTISLKISDSDKC